jgi:hypothetical protein
MERAAAGVEIILLAGELVQARGTRYSMRHSPGLRRDTWNRAVTLGVVKETQTFSGIGINRPI